MHQSNEQSILNCMVLKRKNFLLVCFCFVFSWGGVGGEKKRIHFQLSLNIGLGYLINRIPWGTGNKNGESQGRGGR